MEHIENCTNNYKSRLLSKSSIDWQCPSRQNVIIQIRQIKKKISQNKLLYIQGDESDNNANNSENAIKVIM